MCGGTANLNRRLLQALWRTCAVAGAWVQVQGVQPPPGARRYMVLILCAAAVPLLYRPTIDGWRVNMASVAALHAAQAAASTDGLLLRRRVAMAYLELADGRTRTGQVEVAGACWRSALSQRVHESGDFMVRYRAYSIGLRVSTGALQALDMGRFRVDSVILALAPWPWPPETSTVVRACGGGTAAPPLYVSLAHSYAEAGYFRQACDLMAAVAPLYQPAEWPYLKMGFTYEAWARTTPDSTVLLEKALGCYAEAYRLAGSLFSLHALIQLNTRLGRLAAAADLERLFAAEVNRRQPASTLQHAANQEWTALGYDLHAELLGLASEGPAPICIWWKHGPFADATPPHGGGGGDIVVRCDQVTNLVRNGGFEQDARIGQGFPSGFDSDWFASELDVPAETHNLCPDPLGGNRGNVAWLANTPRSTRTSLQTDPIWVTSGQLFLAVASVRCADHRAFVGNLWLREDLSFNDYSYFGQGGSAQWERWVGLVAAPPGTAATRVWLLNDGGPGSAYFDDVLFAPVQHP